MKTLTPPYSLNLIGPGRLGQTLARLWHEQGLVSINSIVGNTWARTRAACEFIGAGTATTWEHLAPANITLITTPDDVLEASANRLASSGCMRPGDIALHCSGALASTILASLKNCGVHVASIHPLKSFATPSLAIKNFAGTYCGQEGDAEALETLLPLFSAIGANCFAINPAQKTLYHASAVLACNAMVALMHAALLSMATAGVPPETAWPALRPLINGTLSNIDKLGTEGALTGPIARGDVQTVAHQYAALNILNPELGKVYATLGKFTASLAPLSDAQRQHLHNILRG